MSTEYVQANIDRFTGFADVYDQYRPQPPVLITSILTQLLGDRFPRTVVDLGSGTGLSTRIWAGKAVHVIGVEPNADMRAVALRQTPAETRVEYREGFSTATGLDSGSTDIVCVSQAFHWMDPQATLTEVSRILRDGGVFATIDCDWPPTLGWQAEAAYKAFHAWIDSLVSLDGAGSSAKKWPKNQHLVQIESSKKFRYTKELLLHHVESGGAERLIGLALSQGSVQTCLKRGLTVDEIGLTAFQDAVRHALGDLISPWYFSYRVRVGVK